MLKAVRGEFRARGAASGRSTRPPPGQHLHPCRERQVLGTGFPVISIETENKEPKLAHLGPDEPIGVSNSLP